MKFYSIALLKLWYFHNKPPGYTYQFWQEIKTSRIFAARCFDKDRPILFTDVTYM